MKKLTATQPVRSSATDVSERLTYVSVGDWPAPDTAVANIYPGGGLSVGERDAAERHTFLRCCIGTWPYLSGGLTPEHFDPKTLQWALAGAQSVMINLYASPNEAGRAFYSQVWADELGSGAHRLHHATTLELPHDWSDHWKPVLRRWAKCRIIARTFDRNVETWQDAPV